MDVIGEVHCYLARGEWTFELDALVVRQLDVDILAGNPFMVRNDIGVCLAKRQIEICGTEIISYSSPSRHTRQPNVRRAQSFLLRNQTAQLFCQWSTSSSVLLLTLTPTPCGPVSPGYTALLTCHVNQKMLGLRPSKFNL